MRLVLVTLIAFSAAAAASSEPIETITRDIWLASSVQAESLHSLTGAITLQRDARVTGNVETGTGEIHATARRHRAAG